MLCVVMTHIDVMSSQPHRFIIEQQPLRMFRIEEKGT
jgi:hypothetical protein